MRVVTKQDRIKQAIISFRKQWGDGSYTMDTRGILVGFELGLLDHDKATAEEVNKLIGNKSWTELECNECKKDSDAVLELGEKPYYDSATAYICIDCIQKAIKLYGAI